MNIKPLADRLVARRIEEDSKTAGGIIIPDTAQEKPQRAEVLAVGAGARNVNGDIIPMDVKVGDTVLFTKWGGNEVKLDGEELLILKESDVIGIIEKKAAKKKAA